MLMPREQAILDDLRRQCRGELEVDMVFAGNQYVITGRSGADLIIEARSSLVGIARKQFWEARARLQREGVLTVGQPRKKAAPFEQDWRKRRREYLEDVGRLDLRDEEGLA